MDTDFWIESWSQNRIGFHQKDFNKHLVKFWEQLNIPNAVMWQEP